MTFVRFALIAAFVLLARPIWAQSAPQALLTGMDAVEARDWDAVRTAMRGADRLTQDILMRHILRASEGTFEEASSFLARRGDWPGLPFLRQNSETTIPANARSSNVIAFFAPQDPRTGEGALRLATALEASGQRDEARAVRLAAYRSLPMRTETREALVSALGGVSSADHVARAQVFLDRGEPVYAKSILDQLPSDEAALARARIGVQEDADGLTALINAVPSRLAGDPGLAADRFLWRASRGRFDDAVTLTISTPPSSLRAPQRWASWHRAYARRLMREDRPQDAYRLATRHGLTEGSSYVDLEWLAGYLALQKLGDPATALKHFKAHAAAVDTPISLGRAGYWQGRAYEALVNADAARAAFGENAKHQTSFYGLLSAERLSLPHDPALAGGEKHPGWRDAAFTQSSVFEAGVLLIAADRPRLGVRFLTHLAEGLTRDEIGQLGAMAEELGEPYLAVQLAKRGIRYGHLLERPYYPLHPMVNQPLPASPALVLSIARRESEFLPTAVSGVGARGMMQLMPATAQEVAGNLDLPYSASRLLSDPDYNIRLGAAYLAELQDRFGPSPVQIAAAYNAGPSRPLLGWQNMVTLGRVRWISSTGSKASPSAKPATT